MAALEGEPFKELVEWTLNASTLNGGSERDVNSMTSHGCDLEGGGPSTSPSVTTPTESGGAAYDSSVISLPRDESCGSDLPLIRDTTLTDLDMQEETGHPVGSTTQSDRTTANWQDRTKCGLGSCQPNCMQRAANIKAFIVCMSVLTMLSSALSTGYFNSVITTIEKRFEIGSSLSGLIAASFEFGSLLATVFVSYFGSRHHVPRLIGVGVVFIAIGSALFTLPHFIAQTYSIGEGFDLNLTDNNICKSSSTNKADFLQKKCIADDTGNGVYVFLLVIAMVLIGTGNTPIFTLGNTYIDDHVSKKKAPSYIAFIYAASALGPVVGFGLGALLLQYYVDFFTFDQTVLNIEPNDPRWVGAWWAGFIVLGFLLAAVAVPFFCFPKHLQERDKLKEPKVTSGVNNEYGKKFKDLPKSVWKLINNKVFFISSFGICCEISIVSGFLTFLAKYLENEFSLAQSVANLYTGGIAIPGAIVGIMSGGYIMRKLQLQTRGAIQLTLIFCVIALSGFSLFFYLGCDNMKLAGATRPYYKSIATATIPDMEVNKFEANLTSSCNLDCYCSDNDVELICGINGITYFSPCHAGCKQFYTEHKTQKKQNFSDCACIGSSMANVSLDVYASPVARSGPCESTCSTLIPFMMLLFFLTFFTAGPQMPLLMVIMRSVDEQERSFALGIQVIMVRLFAYIPSPLIFGNTIDTACLLWNKMCGKRGSCLIYDIEDFRYKYIGIATGLKIMALTLFSIVCVIIRRQSKEINIEFPSNPDESGTANSQQDGCQPGNFKPAISETRYHHTEHYESSL